MLKTIDDILSEVFESAWSLIICLFLILAGVAMVIFTNGIIRWMNIFFIVTNSPFFA